MAEREEANDGTLAQCTHGKAQEQRMSPPQVLLEPRLGNDVSVLLPPK